jgi:hypothetical protein
MATKIYFVGEDCGQPRPMSAPDYAGTPMPYRLLAWAHDEVGDAYEALVRIREQTDPAFYPLDLEFMDNPERLADEGLLVISVRRIARAAHWLARACCELDPVSLATLRTETKPAQQWEDADEDADFPTNAHLLTTAEEALGAVRLPEQLDAYSGRAWLTDLLAACRLAGAALAASGLLRDVDRDLVSKALAPFE